MYLVMAFANKLNSNIGKINLASDKTVIVGWMPVFNEKKDAKKWMEKNVDSKDATIYPIEMSQE